VPVGSLETPAVADVPALVPLIESVKKHGVLPPAAWIDRARVHGGDATVTLSPRGSRVALTIPADA